MEVVCYQMLFLHLLIRLYNFILCFVNVVCYTDQFAYVELSIPVPLGYTPCDCDVYFLMYCCNRFASILFRISASAFIRYTVVFFLGGKVILARFCYQGYVGFIKCVRKYCLFYFLEVFEKHRFQIFERLVEFTSEAILVLYFIF